MSKEITIHFKDGKEIDHLFPDKLYELDWPKWKKIERKIQKYAVLDRDGEVKRWKEDADFVEIQETLAKVLLEYNDIDPSEVQVQTVKELVMSYGEDMEEFGLKLKKNRDESSNS